ncbi:MAG: glycosyltransferase, partial [Myxococcales bacterium]|nr:glycosyltransferase [Myxococcales bacterium]
ARSDARFRVIPTNREGIVAALNLGLVEARGALVARMDADDWMHRDRLAAQSSALEADPTLAGVGCHVRMFPRRRMSDGLRAYECWLNGIDTARAVVAEAFVECPLAHPSLLLRVEVAKSLGYRDAPWPEDYDFVLRALQAGHRLGVVPRRLLGWRQNHGGLSRRDPRYSQQRFTACKAKFLTTGLLRGRDRYTLWGYGATGRALAKELSRFGRHPKYIVELHPGRLGQQIAGAPVISPDALPPRSEAGPLIASVAGSEARRRIRTHLLARGYRENEDYVCAA